MRFLLAALVVFVAVEESYAGYQKPCTPAYYGNWGKWSRCTRKCGDEDQYRTRKCFPGNCVYSTKCSGPNRQKRSCDLPCCPKDGYWTSWSKYGDCSKSCGGGRQCRSRRCVGRECYGRDCKGSSKDCRSCNDKCCPVDGKWSSWGKYGPCSKTCGGGTQSRSRRCEGRACGGAGCKGNSREQRKCNEDCCPQDGKFTPWGKWERCTKTCGGGTQLRARRCEGQKCGGKGCFGTVAQRRDCNKQCCPKDGSLSEWSRWSKCSKSCGGGSQSRHRACEGQACGGKGCDPYEPLYQSRSCGKKCCPVNGGWSSWSSFGKCSVTCGWGRKYRTRTCTYPAPKCGGRKCRGSNSQSADCDFPPCKKYY